MSERTAPYTYRAAARLPALSALQIGGTDEKRRSQVTDASSSTFPTDGVWPIFVDIQLQRLVDERDAFVRDNTYTIHAFIAAAEEAAAVLTTLCASFMDRAFNTDRKYLCGERMWRQLCAAAGFVPADALRDSEAPTSRPDKQVKWVQHFHSCLRFVRQPFDRIDFNKAEHMWILKTKTLVLVLLTQTDSPGRTTSSLMYTGQEVPNRLWGDKDVVLAAVKADGYALDYVEVALKDDPEVVLAAVNAYGEALEFASSRHKKNHTIVSAAVANDGMALQYADEKLKDDQGVVMAAVERCPVALRDASDRLRRDVTFVGRVVQATPWAFIFVNDAMKRALLDGGYIEEPPESIYETEEELKQSIENGSWQDLEYASARIQDDPSYVRKMVSSHASQLRFASERLRNDETFFLSLHDHWHSEERYGEILMYAGDKLRRKRDFVIKWVTKHPFALTHVDAELWDDIDVVQAARSGDEEARLHSETKMRILRAFGKGWHIPNAN